MNEGQTVNVVELSQVEEEKKNNDVSGYDDVRSMLTSEKNELEKTEKDKLDSEIELTISRQHT